MCRQFLDAIPVKAENKFVKNSFVVWLIFVIEEMVNFLIRLG